MLARQGPGGQWELIDAKTGEIVTRLPGLLAEEWELAARLASAGGGQP
jgi:hypothetical protein